MNKEQLEYLKEKMLARNKPISISDLYNTETDRILLYGYTVERDTCILSLEGGEFCWTVFNSTRNVLTFERLGKVIEDPQAYVPDKRTYPETCDYVYCYALVSKGYNPNFTTRPDDEEKNQERNEYRRATWEFIRGRR